MKFKYKWTQIQHTHSTAYMCGYCGNQLSSEKGFVADLFFNDVSQGVQVFINVCHFCTQPTFFDSLGVQTPAPKYGQEVSGIEDENIKNLYDEARKCIGIGSPTSAVLSCRKLLMHIAVEKGAAENLKFIQYVEYLSSEGYIPPDSKEWVDEIREKGNEATHEIVIMSDQDAKDLVNLTEMLLKIIYQFPSDIKKKRASRVKK